MRTYLTRRLLLFVPSLIGVSLVIFIVMRIVPGDIAVNILMAEGGSTGATTEKLAKLRHELGTDRPLYVQYTSWVLGALKLDFGRSLWTGQSVARELLRVLPVTLELAVLSIALSLVIAIPVGTLSALYQDTWIDYLFRVFTISGIALPIFWTGTLLILALVRYFQWLPPLGYEGFWVDPVTNLKQVVWAVLVLGFALAAVTGRMARSQMLEVLREDYIRTARAKGLAERLVVSRHALKNAALPVLTISSISLGHLLGGAIIVETIFSLPGMGLNLIDAINHRDYPMVQTVITFMALIFLSINLLVDLLYAWLDPRIKYL